MFAHYDQCSHRHHIAVDLFPSSADGHYSGAFPPRSELSPLSATEGPQPQLQIWTSDLIVLAKKARPELRLSLDEVRSPALPNWGRVAVGKQSIGHIFHTTDARRKRSGIQVEDILN
ncbi:hypothetical protein CGCF413_v009095 [Colletotrichum fructicola]|nr:hypothetical protein CGCF413_v014814 [Colletotrichum fructicola]KAF5488295.1 hypothetical protein CGCF413_v012756 [Colletotrichum fructicola]KAF5495592.1 hypothetical protein CGCF413_v009095 [Colletotrichum fructicola]